MTVPVIREHKKITDEIDDMYVTAIDTATSLKTFMVRPKGANLREYFLIFYRAFFGLYLHTRRLPGMESKTEEDILDKWFAISGPISPKRIEIGLRLFAKYQGKLLDNSIVSVNR